MNKTIKDIARYAGVSVSTVSRVLNNKPDVSEKTETKVKESIRILGYSPNNMARGLVLKKTNVIGFVVPDLMNPNFPELARGIIERADYYSYSVIFFDTNHDNKVEKKAIKLFRSNQVDGIIVSFTEANQDELVKLKEENFPCVQIYRKSPKSILPTIAIDNVNSAYTAVKYLLSLGHTKIGHITTGEKTLSGLERLQGYHKAMEEAGIHVRREWIQVCSHSVESGEKATMKILDADKSITAIFSSHDLMAVGAYEAVYSRGLTVPEDISLIGHDNIVLAKFVRPKLTTINTFKKKLGEAAVDLLMEEIQGKDHVQREKVFKTELVIRQSTCPVE
ncbi:MAG: LacI family DNA-binding transcriptional regulator [Spirochaetales bacterium]|nr:LacI family DNA-binding transcriptional regulator [Spirochaetales bacterium]